MCIIYSVRYFCGHLVHLDDPPVTPCSKIRPESSVQAETRTPKSSKKPPPPQHQQRNQQSPQPKSKSPSPPLTRYCPIPLLPTIFHSDQVCRVCSAGLLAYARRVYYFEVGCMMLNMPTRVARERELYFGDEVDGEDRSLEYYEKNIIDRILPPAMLLKCWVAWRLDRERFRTLGVCGGEDGELGRGCWWEYDGDGDDDDDDDDDDDGGGGKREEGGERGREEGGGGRRRDKSPTTTPIIGANTSFKKKAHARPHARPTSNPNPNPNPNTHHHHPHPPQAHFPSTYFFDPFLGDIIHQPINLQEFIHTPGEKALQHKLRMLDAIVEARCLEAYAWEQDARGRGLAELIPILGRAARLRQYCAAAILAAAAGGEEEKGKGKEKGEGEGEGASKEEDDEKEKEKEEEKEKENWDWDWDLNWNWDQDCDEWVAVVSRIQDGGDQKEKTTTTEKENQEETKNDA